MVWILEGSVWSQNVIGVHTCAMSEVCTVVLIYQCCLVFVCRSHQSARDASKENKEQIRNRIWNETIFLYESSKISSNEIAPNNTNAPNRFTKPQFSGSSTNYDFESSCVLIFWHFYVPCILHLHCSAIMHYFDSEFKFENFFLLICIHQMITSMMYHTNGTYRIDFSSCQIVVCYHASTT